VVDLNCFRQIEFEACCNKSKRILPYLTDQGLFSLKILLEYIGIYELAIEDKR